MKKIYLDNSKKGSSLTRLFSKGIFLLFLGMLGIWGTLNAQVSVTATAGTLAGAYGTLKGAFDAINAGTHQGAITININASTSEGVTPAVLNGSGLGAAIYTSVLVRPTANNITVTGNPTTAVVKLNGADNVTIDGSFGGTRQLSIINNNPSTIDLSSCIWVACSSASDGANNNNIRNCIVTGSGISITFIAIVQSGTAVGGIAETENDNNRYENNLITAAESGIALVGPIGNELSNVITGNTIGSTVASEKMSFRSIFLSQQDGVLVTGNTILGNFSTVTGFGNENMGIYVGGTIFGGNIEKNSISDIKKQSVWGCDGILLNSSSANTGLTISNNFIFDVAAGGFNGTAIDDNGYGIGVNAGGGYNIYYNSVDLSTNQPTNTGTTAALWFSTSASINTLNIRNNIFSNRQTNSTRYAVFCPLTNAIIATVNYNDYFSTGSLGFLGGVRANLAAWQTATGQDANSVSIDPNFISASNLHLGPSSTLDGLATPIGAITRDIDGDARDLTIPDIGADEFTPPVCTGNNAGTASASTLSICASAPATLFSTGYDFGTGIAYQWQYFSGSWLNLVGQTNAASANTGLIATTTQFRLKVTCNAGVPGFSNVVTIVVNNPQPTGTFPGPGRCGIGTVSLAATGSNLNWYAAPTGGSSLGTGSPFITPSIAATTNFYVSASVIDPSISGGKPSTNGADGTNPTGGIQFTANTAFILNSVVMYPTAAGTNTINLFAGNTTFGTPIFTINVTFAGANPTGEVVPIGWTIPPGTYTIFQSISGASCWRDFSAASPAVSYPYNIGSACTLNNGSLSGFYYFFYNWNIAPVCEGLRTTVPAIVNAPPAITVTPASATICIGASVGLNVTSGNAGYTYVWNPGSLSGAAQSVTPTATETYTVTATDISGGAFNGCVNAGSVNITVNPTPTTLTVSPSVANVCIAPVITTITATGGLLVNKTILTELFETFPTAQFTTSGSGITATSNTTYFSQGAKSVLLTNIGTTNTTSSYDQASSINLSLYTGPVELSFYHICASEKNFDYGYIEYSTNGGASYTSFPVTDYNGSGSLRNGVISFDAGSYPDWSTQFTGPSVTPGAGPATSLWKRESINLTPYVGNANFKVRFRYTSDPSVVYFGWLIDSIRISGTGQAPVTWLPITDLYSDAGAITPYVLNQPLTTVYCKPLASRLYTAKADGGTCNNTATSNLTVTSVIVNVSITANPATPICAGTSVTFTAVPVNGGTLPNYTWKVNATTVLTGSGPLFSTYTSSTLTNLDTVRCILLSNVGSCAGNNPAKSNDIVMTVYPNPTVNITGAATVCNGAPPTVLTANASIASGSISTYEWFIGGVSQGAPSGINTFNATLPGSYTVVVTSLLGCPTTSAAFVVTLPTYTITASAGANGTISPSGAVVVNCGDDQTFTITPNGGGYQILDVLVDGISNPGAIGSGTYTFTNVTANGHTISATFFLTGCGTPAIANAGADNSFCSNAGYTLNGSITNASTGTWTGGAGTYVPDNTTLNAVYTPSAGEITAGTVTLTLTTDDPPGSCVASSDAVTLTIKEAPVVSITGVTGFCPSTNTVLTAVATVNPAGPITYAWLFNGVTSLGTLVTQASSSGAGTYKVTATGNGCPASASVVVTAFVSPTVSISGSNLICTGTPTDMSATVIAGSGAIPPTGYQWYKNTVIIPGATSSVFSTSVAANYTVTITDANNCVSAVSPIFTLSVDNSPLNGNYTISAAPASCTNYISFASAINDLNTRYVSGDVRFDVPAGYTETAPSLGLALGSANLNASLAGRTLIFRKVGVGANPLISAYAGGTATPASLIPDGIFSLRGADNVTIDGIDLVDNNGANPATMEYGYGLFKLGVLDGAQNNTITNCTITLNRVNNALSSGTTMFEGCTGILVINSLATTAITAVTPTGAAGTNSNNKFYTNTIKNCNNGIGLSGYYFGSGGLTTLNDVGNDVGGLSGTTGNSILNFGGGGTNGAAGIRALNQWTINMSFNTINNNNGSGVDALGVLRGVYAQAGSGASATISNNIVTIKGGGATFAYTGIENNIGAAGAGNTIVISDNTVTGSNNPATSGTWVGIINTATANASTVNINGNIVENCTLPGSGAWTGISNAASTANLSLSNNILRNCTIASTGAFTGIANSGPAVTTQNISGNTVNLITKANTTTVSLMATGASTTSFVNNNIITNNTVNGGAAAVTLNCLLGGISNSTIDGNYIYNNTISGITGAGIASVYGYFNNSIGATQEIIRNNVIRKLFITNSGVAAGVHIVRGISNATGGTTVRSVTANSIDSLYAYVGSNAAINGIFSSTCLSANISQNRIDSLFWAPTINGISVTSGPTVTVNQNTIFGLAGAGGATPVINGVSVTTVAAAGAILNVTKNNIYDISADAAVGTTNTLVNGLFLGSTGTGLTATASNNFISDLRAPASTSTDAIRGISIFNAPLLTTYGIYYNTVYLKAGSSGANFGSSGLSHTGSATATSGALYLKNNIIDNQSTPNGTGLTVAIRRSASALNNFVQSDYNLLYAGATQASPRLLYYDGTVGGSYPTLVLYQAAPIAPRDASSISIMPNYVNGTITPYNIHLKTDLNCSISQSGNNLGILIADDIDATGVRSIVPAYLTSIGADEFTSTGTGPGVWRGVNTVWTDPQNWCGDIPNATTDVTIPFPSSGGFYPVITSATPVARNITITASASITINSGGTLSTKGSWTNNGTLTNNGTIVLNGTSSQSFPGAGTGTLSAMTNLTVNNAAGVTIDKPMVILGTLKPKAGNILIDQLVTLHSDASGTARVDTIQGSISYTPVTGKFSVERFINSLTRTAWRFISAPIVGTQTINAAWQESQAAGVYASTGYGMQITGPGGTGVGFDVATSTPSLKTYNQPTNLWVGVAGTTGPIATTEGYMAFIRGDRGSNTFGSMSNTVLRTSGAIKTGSVIVSTPNANVSKFISVGNPYPSAIDFASASTIKTGLLDVYYIWDPKLGTYGGYQSFSGPTYVATPGGGSYGGGNKFIESGQAFFVISNAAVAPHSLNIVENSKVGSNVLVTRPGVVGKQLNTRLYVLSGTEAYLYDGNRVDFDASNSNAVDDNDAPKLGNFGENIGILTGGKLISVERRAEIVNTDTIFYTLGQMRQQQYQLEFTADNLAAPGLTAFLEDNYLQTSTDVNLDDITKVNFTVDGNAGSYATDRFRLVFRQLGPVPVTFTSVLAYRQNKDIMVSWKVENELNIHHYDVEKSADGRSFTKAGTQVATGNGTAATQYNWLDVQPFGGDNFYRIKSVGIGNEIKFSPVVKVNIAGIPGLITVYPNPVQSDRLLNISMANQPKGIYQVNLLNSTGQVMLSKKINHEGGSSVYSIELGTSLGHGNYLLQVSAENKVKTTFKIVY